MQVQAGQLARLHAKVGRCCREPALPVGRYVVVADIWRIADEQALSFDGQNTRLAKVVDDDCRALFEAANGNVGAQQQRR